MVKKASCILKSELILETPLELHSIILQVQDVNDNSPVFTKDEIRIEISELAVKGSRFRVLQAHDLDIGKKRSAKLRVAGKQLFRTKNPNEI